MIASDAAQDDYFGRSVAISGDYAIIGADGNRDNGFYSGSAYIFERDATDGTWSQKKKLTASDAAQDDYFGSSVAISGDYAIVGAYRNDGPFDSGSAYIYHKNKDGYIPLSEAINDNLISLQYILDQDFITIQDAITQNLITTQDAITKNLITLEDAITQNLITLEDAITQNLITIQDAITQNLITTQDAFDQNLITMQDAIDQSFVDKDFFDNNGYTAIQLYFQYNISITQLISFGYTITFSTTSGDPHVFPVHGKPYELPTTPGFYRMLQGKNLIVNASTRNIYCNERSQIQQYFKARGVSKAQISKLVDDGCFYHKVSIYCDNVSFSYDFDHKKVIFGNQASAKYFNIKTHKSCNMKAYNKYEQCESVASVYVSFTHDTYGPMCLQLSYFSNPQIKHGLTFMTHDVADLSGLLIREYEIPSMTLYNLENICEQEGIVGSNECNTELILFK